MTKLITAFASVFILASIATAKQQPTYSGKLIASYAMEDSSVIVVAYLDENHGLLVTYTDIDNINIELAHVSLTSELGEIQTEVCGGRLHLTYEHGKQIEHVTVDIPSVNLGYLPIVCKEE